MDSFSKYLNKLVNSSLPRQQEKFWEENISLLKKNFCTKDEIIKKLVETQNTVLNTVPEKSSNNIQTLQIKLMFLYHLTVLMKILTTQSNKLNKNNNIHLSHEPVLHNCKKYRIPFKRMTIDPSKISQWKIYLWVIYRKISPNKIFVNFLA